MLHWILQPLEKSKMMQLMQKKIWGGGGVWIKLGHQSYSSTSKAYDCNIFTTFITSKGEQVSQLSSASPGRSLTNTNVPSFHNDSQNASLWANTA